MLAIDRLHDHALEDQAQRAAHRHGGEDRRQEGRQVEPERVGLHPRAERQHDARRHEGADGDEGAVAEVQHVHQAER
jgi:hypothetical protein